MPSILTAKVTAQRTTRSVCSSGVNEEKMASALPFPLPCNMPKQLFPGALRVFKQHTLHHTAKRCPPRARSDCQNIVAKSSARFMRIVCVNLCPPSHTHKQPANGDGIVVGAPHVPEGSSKVRRKKSSSAPVHNNALSGVPSCR